MPRLNKHLKWTLVGAIVGGLSAFGSKEAYDMIRKDRVEQVRSDMEVFRGLKAPSGYDLEQTMGSCIDKALSANANSSQSLREYDVDGRLGQIFILRDQSTGDTVEIAYDYPGWRLRLFSQTMVGEDAVVTHNTIGMDAQRRLAAFCDSAHAHFNSPLRSSVR